MANSTSAMDALLSNHSRENRGPEVLAACIISMVFCVLATVIRLVAQATIRRLFTPDSILIIFAAILALAVSSCTIVAVKNGLGRHEYWVMKEDPHPPERTALIFEMGYVVTVLQAVALMFNKLSILFFYQRAFTSIVRSLRYTIWALFVFCTGLGVGSTVAFICACVPPQMFWLRVYPIFGFEPPEPLHGTCEPQRLHLGVPLLLDLFSEVVMLLVPVIVLWNLQMPYRKKVAVIFTFTLGGFVTAISAVRFYYSWQLENGGDLSWDDTDSYLWNSVQLCWGVVTACIPASAPLLRVVQKSTTASKSRRPFKAHGYMMSTNGRLAQGKGPRHAQRLGSVTELTSSSWDEGGSGPWTNSADPSLELEDGRRDKHQP
ncbi:hypothetical protein AbraIFM66950_007673 [Aspergillus brasiliensis]|uniref:Rhodopsin domain-containing protein n=1 Tax=Aspergillus brasiliensis (strain CBS 101740 / IMI 381727 / IBT 21946) TaxID=767769 RepID=A0A1L9V2D7_ASPBC|nr:hypothetical protein ASPBRDRAFT_142258 [Aspergillus brasiliensis CBS 101740]GKZ30065.1 hypothetical protein AbraIFM66950_007673 [Aspergillus brasiliensis]